MGVLDIGPREVILDLPLICGWWTFAYIQEINEYSKVKEFGSC